MPGFVMHIAIGQEYAKKHKNIENYDEFIRGNILPDLTKEKSKTHYGKSPAYTNLKKFLQNNKIDTSLNQGIFLHLIADYLFYNHYIDRITKEILHNDYDLINKALIEEYNVELLEEIKNSVYFKDGNPQILTLDLAEKVINEVSSLDIDEVEKEVLAEEEKWNSYKNLI